MLSMKTLRVAVAAALLSALLAPGAVLAQNAKYNLDAPPAAKPAPIHFALETLPGGPKIVQVGPASYSTLNTPGDNDDDTAIRPDEAAIGTTVLLENDSRWYLRVALDGMVFADAVTSAEVSVQGLVPNDQGNEDPIDDAIDRTNRSASIQVFSGGDKGSTSVVFRVNETAGVVRGDKIIFNFTDKLAAPSRRVGEYGMSMSLHSTTNDAQSGANPVGGMGSATLVSVVSGLNVEVMANPGIEADVSTGFLWFTNPGGAGGPNRAQVNLGNATVDIADTGNAMLYNADTGAAADPTDFVTANSVIISVSGDLSIGAFSVVEKGDDCPANGSAESPNPGNLRDSTGKLLTAEGANLESGSVGRLAAGVRHDLCVDVDAAGPESNATPIPVGVYNATVWALTPADLDDPEPIGNGVIGRIGRNGASVHIPYLTTSEKHNQRVIVVNRGPRPISIVDFDFQTEDGTMVELTDAAMAAQEAGATIGPGEAMVRRVSDMIDISGMSRRAAVTMSFNGLPHNISVATTQVNLEDSSTDTVSWMVE